MGPGGSGDALPVRARGRDRGTSAVAIVTGLALVVPFAVALAGFVGDRWFLTGDLASIHLRIREVGGHDTPLVGAYSTRGWAHPGPVIFWLGMPLDRLSGGDPRSMLVTAAIVNLAAIGMLLHVVRRRAGIGMEVAAALAVALLAHGLGPGRLVDLWNPIVPLFSLLLLTFLAWSAATGEPRHATWAIAVGALVTQAHIGLLPVVGAVAAWAVAWGVLAPRLGLRAALPDREAADAGPDRTERPWRTAIGRGLLIAGLAWLPPLLDLVAGTGNLRRVFGYFVLGQGHPVGLHRGAGLVSRYVRPDGPWSGGPEPTHGVSVQGGGPWPLILVALALATASVLLWRRREWLALAGTTLTLTLLVAAVPIASKVDEPVFDYLVKWLTVVGTMSWFWLAWGTWRLAAPHLAWLLERRPTAWLPAAVGVPVVVLIAAWSIPGATRLRYPAAYESTAVASLRTQLEAEIPYGSRARIENRGDLYGNVGSGLIYWLLEDGRRIVTSDGARGQKYGPTARWTPATQTKAVYTVVVHYPYDMTNRDAWCQAQGAKPVAVYDKLDRHQRMRLTYLGRKRLFHPTQMTAAEIAEGRLLAHADFRVTVYRWKAVCAGAS